MLEKTFSLSIEWQEGIQNKYLSNMCLMIEKSN
jgi:hypothetical protein